MGLGAGPLGARGLQEHRSAAPLPHLYLCPVTRARQPVQDICFLLQLEVAGPESSLGGLVPWLSRTSGVQCWSWVERGGVCGSESGSERWEMCSRWWQQCPVLKVKHWFGVTY